MMTRSKLEVFLPLLMLFFLVVFLIWNLSFQQRLLKGKKTYSPPLTRINQSFQILLGLAALIVGLYAFLPEFYILLIPLDSLDKPLINNVGGFILRVAIFWLLSSMLHTSFLFQKLPDKQKITLEVYVYAQKTVLISVVLLLVGLAVTISSLGAFLLCLIGLYFYYRFYYQAENVS
ncbi:hypothetical protein [Adhaeribacter radiodurans]|uniref:Uncharacterized protein n=1 Tax=Adhaeribacter radiodurans TaxID=2745197 RepID=A0A7L7L3F8_9BACT|nr:hypothetical protein [Adhaeribacter radiodurans]QMU27105.1 hypothetical protein HUW48_03245 [Adhaeribacter radiodurans]